MLKILIFVVLLSLAACNTTPEPTATITPTSTTTPPTATPVESTATTTITGRFTGAVNARLYAFDGHTGTPVSFIMTPLTPGLDPYLVLLGPDGQVYSADDDGGPVGVSAALTDFALPVNGTYYLLATSNRGLSNAPAFPEEGGEDYQIEFDGVDTLAAPDFTVMTPLDIARGETQELMVTAERPVFYVPIEARAGQTLSIITDGEPFAVDTLLYLFNAAGERIAVNDDTDGDRGDSTYARLESFVFPREGVYVALVTVFGFDRAYQPGWPGAGTFTLRLA